MLASVAMIAMTTSSSIKVNAARALARVSNRRRLGPITRHARALVLDDTEHLFDRGEPGLRLLPAGHSQRHEPVVDRDRAQLTTRYIPRDRVLYALGHNQEFVDTETSLIARTTTCRATRSARERPLGDISKREQGNAFGRRPILDAASATDAAH